MLKSWFHLLFESAQSWANHRAPKMGAALAYYTAFSLAPVIILVLSLVSLFMKQDDASKKLVAQISDLVGADGGKVVQEILNHAGNTKTLSWSTALSFILLWVSASSAFGELQDSLNIIWDVPKRKHAFRAMLKDRLTSFSMVLVLGFFMLTSLLFTTFITGLTHHWGGHIPKTSLEMVNTFISFFTIGGLFALVFKLLPDIKIHWHDVIGGAVFTSFLFTMGKFLLGFYIAHSSFASSYGAAASFIVILVWVFYSAQILYFGAEFTRAYAFRYGSMKQKTG